MRWAWSSKSICPGQSTSIRTGDGVFAVPLEELLRSRHASLGRRAVMEATGRASKGQLGRVAARF